MGACFNINISTKALCFIGVTALLLYIYFYPWNLNQQSELIGTTVSLTLPEELKYILQWTSPRQAPFDFLKTGRSAFEHNNCKYRNCFVTGDRDFMDVTEFDAVAFNGKDVVHMQANDFPHNRSAKQKYIFAAMESAHYYPVCNKILDGFFNWTWTYKLDSDFRWGYITIYDRNGTVVGPARDMIWPELEPIGEDLKTKLRSKSKAVAWFVSNCRTKSNRESFVRTISRELRKYNLTVDVYGECGKYKCPRNAESRCDAMLQRDYYFYLSFENSFAEDYVTEKLLTALNNFAVPVVYGAANYSRFLPPGSYLDARELGAAGLARTMDTIMNNESSYHDYHRWRSRFTYKETSNNEDLCKLCEMLNDEQRVQRVSVYENFRDWWNGHTVERICGR